ncbi:LysR family transcriptional regulator, partial [Pseudomonas sp. ER28]|nr:LysR family transcriptional regulator [Pseudomonas sp. ER28]
LKVLTGKGYYLVSQARSLPPGLLELLDWLEGQASL